jgi:hypothetical protein
MKPHKQRLWSMLKRQKAVDPMGATNRSALRVTFNSRLKLEFLGSKVTSDAGLLAYRELDEALELTARSGGLLDDWRSGKNTWRFRASYSKRFWSGLDGCGCPHR